MASAKPTLPGGSTFLRSPFLFFNKAATSLIAKSAEPGTFVHAVAHPLQTVKDGLSSAAGKLGELVPDSVKSGINRLMATPAGAALKSGAQVVGGRLGRQATLIQPGVQVGSAIAGVVGTELERSQ